MKKKDRTQANKRNGYLDQATDSGMENYKYLRVSLPTSSGKTYWAAQKATALLGKTTADGEIINNAIFVSPQIEQLKSFEDDCVNVGIKREEIRRLPSLTDSFIHSDIEADELLNFVQSSMKDNAQKCIDRIKKHIKKIKTFKRIKSNTADRQGVGFSLPELNDSISDEKKMLQKDISELTKKIKNYLLSKYGTVTPKILDDDVTLNTFYPGRQFGQDKFKVYTMTTKKAFQAINPFSLPSVVNPQLPKSHKGITKNSLLILDEIDAQCQVFLDELTEKTNKAKTDIILMATKVIDVFKLERPDADGFDSKFIDGHYDVSKVISGLIEIADDIQNVMTISGTISPDFRCDLAKEETDRPLTLLRSPQQTLLTGKNIANGQMLIAKPKDDKYGKRFEVHPVPYNKELKAKSFDRTLSKCTAMFNKLAQLCRYFANNLIDSEHIDQDNALESTLSELKITDPSQKRYIKNTVFNIPNYVIDKLGDHRGIQIIDAINDDSHVASTHFMLYEMANTPEECLANAIAHAGFTIAMSATSTVESVNNFDFKEINAILENSSLLKENGIHGEYVVPDDLKEKIKETIEQEAKEDLANTEFVTPIRVTPPNPEIPNDAKNKIGNLTGIKEPLLSTIIPDGINDFTAELLNFATQAIYSACNYDLNVVVLFQSRNPIQGKNSDDPYSMENLRTIADAIAKKENKAHIKVLSLSTGSFERVKEKLQNVSRDTLYVLVTSYSSISVGYNITYKLDGDTYDIDGVALGRATNIIASVGDDDSDRYVTRLANVYKNLKNEKMLRYDYPSESLDKLIWKSSQSVLENILKLSKTFSKDLTRTKYLGKYNLISPYEKAEFAIYAQAIGRMCRGYAKNKHQLIVYSSDINRQNRTSEEIDNRIFGNTIMSVPLQILVNSFDQQSPAASSKNVDIQEEFRDQNNDMHKRLIFLLSQMQQAKDNGQPIPEWMIHQYIIYRDAVINWGYPIKGNDEVEQARKMLYLTEINGKELEKNEMSINYWRPYTTSDDESATLIAFEHTPNSSLQRFNRRFEGAFETVKALSYIVQQLHNGSVELPKMLYNLLQHTELKEFDFPYTPTTSAIDIMAGQFGEGLLELILRGMLNDYDLALSPSLDNTNYEDFK